MPMPFVLAEFGLTVDDKSGIKAEIAYVDETRHAGDAYSDALINFLASFLVD